MRSLKTILCIGALAACLGQAASPQATVTSETSFRLRGAVVPVAGVPSWPLLTGDEIATDLSAAVIRFADGSSVTLKKSSAARLEQVRGNFVFRLLSGAMDVKPANGSRVGFFTQAQPLDAPAGQVTKTSALTSHNGPPPPPPHPGPPHGPPPGPPPGHPPPPPPVSRR